MFAASSDMSQTPLVWNCDSSVCRSFYCVKVAEQWITMTWHCDCRWNMNYFSTENGWKVQNWDACLQRQINSPRNVRENGGEMARKKYIFHHLMALFNSKTQTGATRERERGEEKRLERNRAASNGLRHNWTSQHPGTLPVPTNQETHWPNGGFKQTHRVLILHFSSPQNILTYI